MANMVTRENYRRGFQEVFQKNRGETMSLENYVEEQFSRLDGIIEQIGKENFWQFLPEIMGIDAKLSLLSELIKWEDFSEEEIIRMVETDYLSYFKELCGYSLSTEVTHSLVFNVV